MSRGYSNSTEKIKKHIKEAITKRKQYLADNDLEGFYKNLEDTHEEDHHGLELAGYITEFLYDCGINVTTVLVNGYVPMNFYCFYINPGDIADNLLTTINLGGNDVTCLQLPWQVKEIKGYAFIGNDSYEAVDLRGIRRVERDAFSYNHNELDLIIDSELRFIGRAAFDGTTINTIWLDGIDKDTAVIRLWDMFVDAKVDIKQVEWKKL